MTRHECEMVMARDNSNLNSQVELFEALRDNPGARLYMTTFDGDQRQGTEPYKGERSTSAIRRELRRLTNGRRWVKLHIVCKAGVMTYELP